MKERSEWNNQLQKCCLSFWSIAGVEAFRSHSHWIPIHGAQEAAIKNLGCSQDKKLRLHCSILLSVFHFPFKARLVILPIWKSSPPACCGRTMWGQFTTCCSQAMLWFKAPAPYSLPLLNVFEVAFCHFKFPALLIFILLIVLTDPSANI